MPEERFETAQQIKDSLNFAERVLAGADPTDDYLEALVRTNVAIAQALVATNAEITLDRSAGVIQLEQIDRNNLPIGVAGESLDNISKNQTGDAVFTIRGTSIQAKITAENPIAEEDTVIVTDSDNRCVPDKTAEKIVSSSSTANVVQDQTSSVGEGSAAEISLGANRRDADIWYDVSANPDTIEIEVSYEGTQWRTHTSIETGDIVTGGQLVQIDTAYTDVRVYASSGFDADQVDTIEIVGK